MRNSKLVAIVVLLAIAAILASACGGGHAATNTNPTVQSSEITKPLPTVLLVDATTVGVFDNYYAVLNITAKNEGADGMIIVVGSITQGGVTKKNEMPVYLTKGSAQTVKLVFPLVWRGGAWEPSVSTEVP